MQEKITLDRQLSINQRVKNVRLYYNLTQEEFANETGTTRGTIAQIELERHGPTLELVQNIVRKYNIPYTDLIEGVSKKELQKRELQQEPQREPHLKITKHKATDKDPPGPLLISPKAEIITVTVDTDGNNVIPILDIQAAAGWPSHVNDPKYFKNLPALTMPWVQFGKGDYVLVQVSGDSMQPTVYNSDWLFSKRIYDIQDIRDGYVHVIVTDTGVLCKRILNRIDKRKALALQSDNEQYPTYDLPVDQVLQIWKVEFKMSAILRNENSDLRKDIKHLQQEIIDIKDRLLDR